MTKALKKTNYSRVLWYFGNHMRKYPFRLAFILLATIIGTIAGATAPIYLKQLIDTLIQSPTEILFGVALTSLFFYIGIRALNLIFVRSSFWSLTIFDANMLFDLRTFAFSRLLEHSHSFFTNSFTGSLTNKISKFARAFEAIWDIFVMQVLPLILWMGTALYMISRFNTQVALIFALGLLVYFIFNYAFFRYNAKYDRAVAEADTAIASGFSDSISNHLTIQLFTGSTHEKSRIGNILSNHREKILARWKRIEFLFTTQAVMFTFLEFFILKYSIIGWREGVLTAGTIVLFQVYILGMVNRLFDFSQVFRRMSEAFSDANEMVEILEKPLEVTDTAATTETPPTVGTIEFKNTDFAYHDGQDLIGGLSLSIKKGEKVALVGVSGAGKSTLFKLLLRLYDRTGGELLIDGMPIESYTQEAMRGGVGFVPQEPSLFHRSLMENIRYGRRDASEEEVRQAAKAAECLEFIEKLPHGFDTLVGERGVKLSGGERQRVAIARAILKNAPILLLDEATSALDSHSELEIQRALERLMADKTVVAIAHRLSTIKKMDRIILLENGKIVEEGTHDSLLEKENGIYRKLWELQVGGFIAD